MCGLLGIVRTAGGGVDPIALRQATALLRHRGPDDEGYLLGAVEAGEWRSYGGPETAPGLGLPALPRDGAALPSDIAFGFRRLAIIDPSAAGHQPMEDAEGGICLVFNGEIYNHQALRSALTREGHHFRGRTDTETLLAALRRWGAGAFDRLEGMWAFAAWLVRERRLLLSRDRLGIKPLYWTATPTFLAFASEIRPLLRLRERAPRAHAPSTYRYLRFGITDAGSETLFEGIHRVPPGHVLSVDLERPRAAPRPHCYWQLPEPDPEPRGAAQLHHEVRRRFLASVEGHLLSDVPLGFNLSGGLDSSAILCATRTIVGPEMPLRAFAYLAGEPSIDEEAWVQRAARAADARVATVRPDANELGKDFDRLVELQEEPFGSTSIYAQYRVFGLARRAGVPVVLGGQGADELLGGYRAHLGPRLASLLATGELRAARRLVAAARGLPDPDLRGVLLRTGRALLPPALEPVARCLAGERLLPVWLNRRWFRERGLPGNAPTVKRSRQHLRAYLNRSLVETSLPMLLRFEDRNAMAHSVENRVPFLDRPLVELLASLPEERLIRDDATSKAVFRRAMQGLLPEPIRSRRDKVGFATPEAAWLGTLQALVQRHVLGETAARIPVLNASRLLEQWERSVRNRSTPDFRLWRGINLVAWAERFQVEFED